MQTVERGKRAIGDWAEFGSSLMLDCLVPFKDHCELIKLLHGYVVATKSVCESGVGKIAEVLDDHATRGRRPALSLSYEYR